MTVRLIAVKCTTWHRKENVYVQQQFPDEPTTFIWLFSALIQLRLHAEASRMSVMKKIILSLMYPYFLVKISWDDRAVEEVRTGGGSVWHQIHRSRSHDPAPKRESLDVSRDARPPLSLTQPLQLCFLFNLLYVTKSWTIVWPFLCMRTLHWN